MDASMGSGTIENTGGNANSRMEYLLTVKLSVEDVSALWDLVARRCRDEGGLSPEDIAETIGPREDPSIEDCLLMAALPTRIDGCTMLDVGLRRPSTQFAEHDGWKPRQRLDPASLRIALETPHLCNPAPLRDGIAPSWRTWRS